MKIAAALFTMLFAANSVRAEPLAPKTKTGSDISLSYSSYLYEEPGVMSSRGDKIGFDLNASSRLQYDQFTRGELRYAYGKVDYTGSGVASGQPDWYLEARGLAGKDWAVGNAVLSPYVGFGYRYLFNDARGISSTGAAGYRRESNYVYLPVGVMLSSAFRRQTRWVGMLEYDHLLVGKQISKLSDTGLGYDDVVNTQRRGRGLKVSVMYERGNWVIGPFAHYWKIGQSDSVILHQYGAAVGAAWEPESDTTEFGFKAGWEY